MSEVEDEGIVFIDGDLLVYKIGAVGQVTSVDVDVDDIPRGNFKNKTEARAHFDSQGIEYKGREEYTVVTKPKPWPIVASGGTKFINKIIRLSGCKKYRIYVEAPEVFRKSLASIKPYKASKGREQAEKPFYYSKIRQWLIDEFGAVLTRDIESDDYISIATSMGYYKGKKWVGATIDKDAKQTEGDLLNWDIKPAKVRRITPLEGLISLWKQMLTGDTVDNIQGCRGVADKSPLMTEINKCETELEMYEIVREKYFTTAKTKGLVRTYKDNKELSVLDEMKENFALLFMYRKRPKYTEDGKLILESDIKIAELEAEYQLGV